jgi:cob(I)alamin adenosyltransferase
MKIYTRKGDDGTTGLYGGGRVRKDSAAPEAYGTVDEAQAALGLARALAERASLLDKILIHVERDLWILMAELATEPENAAKLVDGASRVTPEMVAWLETTIDEVSDLFEMPTEFVVPGETPLAATLDVARTVVRRAERRSMVVAADGSQVVPYLNRLSDLAWSLARWAEGASLPTRSV